MERSSISNFGIYRGRQLTRARALWRDAARVVWARWDVFLRCEAHTRAFAFASYVTALDAEEAAAAEMARLLAGEQLSNVVDLAMKNDQAATLSSVISSSWLSSSVTLMPSLNFTPASTSATSSWPLNRRQRSCADSSSL